MDDYDNTPLSERDDHHILEYYKTVEFSMPIEDLWGGVGFWPEYIRIHDITPQWETRRTSAPPPPLNGDDIGEHEFIGAHYIPIHTHPSNWHDERPNPFSVPDRFRYSRQWLEGDFSIDDGFVENDSDGTYSFTFSDNVSELYTAIYKIVPSFYCPIVYVLTDPDSGYIPENNTLPQTMDSDLEGSIIEDYLPIKTNPPVEIAGTYQLRVRELQQLKEEFDYFSLVGIDRNIAEGSAVSLGRYFTYGSADAIAPVSAVTFEGEDVTGIISAFDDEEFVCDGPGGLILTFAGDFFGRSGSRSSCAEKSPEMFH
ncbi:hypothetical protein DRQ36_08185 [bacterium]|nr:MAG: hypothetical protein DRQ36_08185 [bacterium]